MAVFRYKTFDASGRPLSGMIDADSADLAAAKLKGKGLFPFEVVRETDAGAGKERKREKGGRIRSSDITVFIRQLASLSASGMPLVECLTALSEQTSRGALKTATVEIKEKIAAGRSLSDSLSDYPAVFSPTFVSLVRAGEAGGELDKILEELADAGEKQEAIKGKVTAALVYPLFMTVVGTAVLTLLFILVIPKIISIFGNMGQALPLPTKLLILATNLVRGWWPLLILAAALLWFFIHRTGKTERGKLFLDGLMLKLPVAGGLFCRLDVSRFARTLALLLKGGVPITQALDIARQVVKNSVIAGNIAEARDNIAEGGDLSPPLKAAGIFPPIAVHMIAVGEKGGTLEAMLLNVANGFDREIEVFTGALSSIVEPVLIIAMGLSVGFIALAVLLPIFEMNMMVK